MQFHAISYNTFDEALAKMHFVEHFAYLIVKAKKNDFFLVN